MKGKYGAILTLGFALFAMFFGAGNLVLPPMIGLEAGDKFSIVTLGFFITAILAPFLAVLAIIIVGKNFNDFQKYLPKSLIILINFLIILCIGPLIAIPRTGATTYEVGIQPILPEFNNLLFAIIFFVIVGVLSISPGKIVDVIGKYLTPILIITLFVLIILGIIYPVAAPREITLTSKEVFKKGFLEGYQTLDVLGGVVFAGIIVSTAIDKGFSSLKQRIKACTMAGIIAMSALLFIYGGLLYLGVTSGYTMDNGRTSLLLYISQSILGAQGMYIVSIAMAMACLTTAIALTSATASFFESLTNKIIPYKIGVILCCLVSVYFSIKSVDEIIAYAVNILLFVYPIVFALIILVLIFGRKIKSKIPYVVAVVVAGSISLFSVLQNVGYTIDIFETFKHYMPLSSYSLEWLLPSFVGFILAELIIKFKKK